MKANEFIKKFGLDVAKDLAYIDKTSVGYLSVEHHDVCQDDLKRLAESHELVEECGGLRKVKDHIKQGNVYRFEEKPLMVQAISDVEACQ